MKLNICSDESTPGCNSNSAHLPLVGNYAAKVLWEVLATPLTYKIVAYLKRVEQEDYYHVNTNFTSRRSHCKFKALN
jgi:hypothetical protein